MEKRIIKSTDKTNLEMSEDIEDVCGQVRLWIEGKPPKPTDVWIIIGDYNVASLSTQEIKSKDINLFDGKIQMILDNTGVKLSDYGPKRNFHMDICVSKEVIDGYTR